MTQSALLNHPPANEEDYLMARYLIATSWKGPGPIPPMTSINASAGYNGASHRPTTPGDWDGSRAIILQVLNPICCVFIGVITILRLGLRLHPNMKLAIDDYAIAACTIFTIALFGLQYRQTVVAGTGKHVWDTTYQEQKESAQLWQPISYCWWIASALVKISIMCYLHRITAHIVPRFKYWMWAHNTCVTIYTIFVILFYVCACGNPRWRFDPIWAAQQNRAIKCIDNKSLVRYRRAADLLHVFFDFTLVFAAGYLCSRIKIGWSRKMSLLVFSLLPLGTCGFAIARTVHKWHPTGVDSTWSDIPLTLYTVGDLTLAILVANSAVFYKVVMEKRFARKERQERWAEVKSMKAARERNQQIYSTYSESTEGGTT